MLIILVLPAYFLILTQNSILPSSHSPQNCCALIFPFQLPFFLPSSPCPQRLITPLIQTPFDNFSPPFAISISTIILASLLAPYLHIFSSILLNTFHPCLNSFTHSTLVKCHGVHYITAKCVKCTCRSQCYSATRELNAPVRQCIDEDVWPCAAA